MCFGVEVEVLDVGMLADRDGGVNRERKMEMLWWGTRLAAQTSGQ